MFNIPKTVISEVGFVYFTLYRALVEKVDDDNNARDNVSDSDSEDDDDG